ncbi:MAG: hypothetical protein ACJAYU_002233, partial [Bradymonadia bacterium]
MPLLLFALILPGLAVSAEPRTVQQAVVYGSDDRLVSEQHPNEALRAVAERSLVAIVDSERILDSGSEYETASLGDRQNLCEGERFRELPTLARCTGVLIAEDLVLTAGHCMENIGACRSRSVVFDWRVQDGEVVPPSPEAVYSCAAVVVADSRGYANLTLDYAVIRLDRAVDSARDPVPIRLDPVAAGDLLALVSHPSGLPAIIDTGGSVVDAREGERDYFVVSADSFEGSSGGPVLDASGALVGVLVRGEEDYVASGECRVVNVLSEPAEEVTRVDWVLRELCRAIPRHALCAGRDACGVLCDAGACLDECESESPRGWSCVDEVYAAGDGCDCDCGDPDPDCDREDAEVFGCGAAAACSRAGECTSLVEAPDGWLCNAAVYGDGTCDCACGAV